MLKTIFIALIAASWTLHHIRSVASFRSPFEFSKEARDALCPFVGTDGMQCFDDQLVKSAGTQFDSETIPLPRGVGISIDRSSGRLKALVVQLTSSPDTGRIWTDGFRGQMFDIQNEVMLSSPHRIIAAYNESRIHVFRHASQLAAAWDQTFVDGKIRGGSLSRPPELSTFVNEFTRHDHARVLSQSVVGLYVLTMRASNIQLNSFARQALGNLTSAFDLDLYDDFVEKWGTHVVTKSLIGGMIEEEAKVVRCFSGGADSMVVQCLPFEWSQSRKPVCAYYSEQNRVVSKRRLGGNAHARNAREWKESISYAPAMLQVLEMVPWYELVTDESIKRNLRTIMRHRQKVADSGVTSELRWADARLASCSPVMPNLSIDASWEQNGITIAGINGQGGNHNQLNIPHTAVIDDDDEQTVVISDYSNHRIIQCKMGDPNGQVVAGGNGQGNRLDQLNYPTCALIDKETNSLIIADRGNRRVVRWSRRSGTTQGAILVEGIMCSGLAMSDQRHLYVTDVEKNEVRRYEIDQGDKVGTLVAGGNGLGIGLNQLNWPAYIFIDRSQSLYVSDHNNHRVMKWNKGATQGIVVAGGEGGGGALTQLHVPAGIFMDNWGSLYVTEYENSRVTRWPQGSKQGTVVVGGNGKGIGANQLTVPQGLSFDKYGNLYVVDAGNHRVQRFNRLK